MALYSVNTNLKGVYPVFTAQQVAPSVASAFVPMFVCPLLTASLSSVMSGTTQANSNTLQCNFQVPSSVNANQLIGNYLYVTSGSVSEAHLILANTAASSASATTVTVDQQFASSIGLSGTATVRAWQALNIPVFVSSLNQFATTWLSTNSNGDPLWAGSEDALYTIGEAFNKGASSIVVLPVEMKQDSASLITNLAPTGNATFLQYWNLLSPQVELICCPKQANCAGILTAANWATIDLSWQTFCTNLASVGVIAPVARESVYVTDAGASPSTSAEVSYRTTTLNVSGQNAERVVLVGNQYYVGSQTVPGTQVAVAASPAYVGLINAVSSGVPGSFGHAMSGKYMGVPSLGLVEKTTATNRVTLQSNGVNNISQNPGLQPFFENEYTQRKTSSTSGTDAREWLHAVLVRLKIINTLNPLLDSIQDEPNTPFTRQTVKTLGSRFMDSLVSQGIVSSYVFNDVTSTADQVAGTARFELQCFTAQPVQFIEIKFVSAIG